VGSVAGPLTALQEKDIAECFGMLDEDGSGALDVSELVKAFKMLGFQVECLHPPLPSVFLHPVPSQKAHFECVQCLV